MDGDEEQDRQENEGEERGHREGGMRIRPNYFMPKPVKVGDEIDVTIEAVAQKGDGIAKVDGFVVFVKGAKQGDKIKVRISEVKARFAIGEPI